MIFIGAELNNPNAHFVTNIIDCIGDEDDLIIDLLESNDSKSIFEKMKNHCRTHIEKHVIYNPYANENFFINFKTEFPELSLIVFFSDDEWRHEDYDRYLALYADIFSIAVKANVAKYQSYGLSNTYYMQWACNPRRFYPQLDRKKKYDVSFIGTAYGKRVEYIKYLIKSGVDVAVFGAGWNKYFDIRSRWGGYLSSKGMVDIINQSRINLNFLWTSKDEKKTTIKGRTMEIAACCAFQLSNFTEEFDNYGFLDGDNINVFLGKDDLVKKIKYYLSHEDEREKIAETAYQFVSKNHVWKNRFENIFNILTKNKVTPAALPKYRVLVLVLDEISHQIDLNDTRMNIEIVSWHNRCDIDFCEYDGIIQLVRNSSINNDSLFMMSFGLYSDHSDIVIANFYLSTVAGKQWIGFDKRIVEENEKLISYLPQECMMVSGQYMRKITDSGNSVVSLPIRNIKITYIGHPTFILDLPFLYRNLLCIYFSKHTDIKKVVLRALRNLNFIKAVILLHNRILQKYILRTIR